jgi:two-component system OmpR family response regulator
VLVAEDNALVVGAMRLLLEESGFRVSICGSIASTVATAAADPVDVLLLDLGLPDGDGMLALSELRALGAPPHVAVALTGRDEPEVAARCIEGGCAAVLVKPVPARELVAKVREWTSSPR